MYITSITLRGGGTQPENSCFDDFLTEHASNTQILTGSALKRHLNGDNSEYRTEHVFNTRRIAIKKTKHVQKKRVEVSSIKIPTHTPPSPSLTPTTTGLFFPYFRTFATETFIFQEEKWVYPKLFFLAENQEYIISFEVLLHPVLIFIKVETKFPYFPPPSASIWGANSLDPCIFYNLSSRSRVGSAPAPYGR